MIRESGPWKAELKRQRRALEKLASVPLQEALDDFKLEKPLHYSALIMRRLIECRKTTDRIRAVQFDITTYPTFADRHDTLARLTMQGWIDEEFDLDSPEVQPLDCWNICNELLHSGFINWEVNENHEWVGIYVASGRNHLRRLLQISLTTYLEMIDAILLDQVVEAMSRIEDGKLFTERS